MKKQANNNAAAFSWWHAFFVGLGIIPGSYIIAPIFDTFICSVVDK